MMTEGFNEFAWGIRWRRHSTDFTELLGGPDQRRPDVPGASGKAPTEKIARDICEKLQTRSALGLLFSKLFQCPWGYGGIHRSVTSHAHRWGPFVGYSFLHSTHPFMNACICSQTHTHKKISLLGYLYLNLWPFWWYPVFGQTCINQDN